MASGAQGFMGSLKCSTLASSTPIPSRARMASEQSHQVVVRRADQRLPPGEAAVEDELVVAHRLDPAPSLRRDPGQQVRMRALPHEPPVEEQEAAVERFRQGGARPVRQRGRPDRRPAGRSPRRAAGRAGSTCRGSRSAPRGSRTTPRRRRGTAGRSRSTAPCGSRAGGTHRGRRKLPAGRGAPDARRTGAPPDPGARERRARTAGGGTTPRALRAMRRTGRRGR